MAYTGLVMGADGAPVDARLNSSIYAQAPRDMKNLPMLCCGFVHGTMEYTGVRSSCSLAIFVVVGLWQTVLQQRLVGGER